ncbi:hypothetical protein QJQ45_026336, partial [Haematococcus lacustris]
MPAALEAFSAMPHISKRSLAGSAKMAALVSTGRAPWTRTANYLAKQAQARQPSLAQPSHCALPHTDACVLHCCLQTLNDTKQRLQEVEEENAREKQDWQQQELDWQQQHHDLQHRQQDWQQQHQDWQQRQQDWQQQQQLLEKQLHDLLQQADIHAHIIVVSAANELARLKEQLNVAQARLAHQASGAEQLQQSVVRLTAAVCAADARAVAAEASSIGAAAVAADASSDAHASATLLEQEQGGVVKLLSAAAISAGHQQHPIYVVHCYEHILHNA